MLINQQTKEKSALRKKNKEFFQASPLISFSRGERYLLKKYCVSGSFLLPLQLMNVYVKTLPVLFNCRSSISVKKNWEFLWCKNISEDRLNKICKLAQPHRARFVCFHKRCDFNKEIRFQINYSYINKFIHIFKYEITKSI